MKQPAHYIDNKQFYAAMKEWKESWDLAVEKGEPTPRVTEYIGECFVKISNHLAYKANFVNYTFRDEMVLDGIENCLRYADRFNPEKSKNPFAYFTQITYFSFIRRIKKEAKQTETRLRYLQSVDLQRLLEDIESDSGNYEYLNWVQDQLDISMKEKEDMKKMDSNVPKRRPLYLDKKEKELDNEDQ